MTSETVQAQGGAVLEDCAEENCVITLGSRIGADYIVRGILRKFKTLLTLTVEMYETEDGTLVASSEPVRSENAAELLMKTGVACADMYKAFLRSKSSAAVKAPDVEPKPEPAAKAPAVETKPESVAKAPELEPKPEPVAKPPKPDAGIAQKTAVKKRNKLAVAVCLDALGAGLIAYGLYQNSDVKSYVDDGRYENHAEYDSAKVAANSRNVGYVVGGVFLLSGISIHIFF